MDALARAAAGRGERRRIENPDAFLVEEAVQQAFGRQRRIDQLVIFHRRREMPRARPVLVVLSGEQRVVFLAFLGRAFAALARQFLQQQPARAPVGAEAALVVLRDGESDEGRQLLGLPEVVLGHRNERLPVDGDDALVGVRIAGRVDRHRHVALADQGALVAAPLCRGKIRMLLLEGDVAAQLPRRDEIGHEEIQGTVGLRLQDELALALQRAAEHGRQRQRLAEEVAYGGWIVVPLEDVVDDGPEPHHAPDQIGIHRAEGQNQIIAHQRIGRAFRRACTRTVTLRFRHVHLLLRRRNNPASIDAEAPRQNGLLRMEPVFRLVPHDRLGSVDHRCRDLVAPVGGQAVHEDRVVRGLFHERLVDRVGPEQLLAPRGVLLPHRHPGVGDDAVGPAHRLDRIVGELDVGALAFRPLQHRILRVELRRAGERQVELQSRCRMDPRGSDVVAIAGPRDLAPLDRALGLLEGHDVGDDLAGVRLVREPVDDGHGRVRGELQQRFVLVGADHDRVDVARKHLRSVGNGFAPPDLQVVVVEGERLPAELPHGEIERNARARRRLLEDHHQHLVRDAVGPKLRRHAAAGLLHGVAHGDDALHRRPVDAVDVQEMPGKRFACFRSHGRAHAFRKAVMIRTAWTRGAAPASGAASPPRSRSRRH